MAFDNTKYDVEINGKGYRVISYQKPEQDTLVPRFSPGDSADSSFDLLRSKTMDSFVAGSLQRNWKENNQMYAIEGMYPIYDDEAIYGVTEATNITYDTWTQPVYVVSKCKANGYQYVAYRIASGATTQCIVAYYGTALSAYVATLPANLTNGTYYIKDMVFTGTQIFITAENSAGTAGTIYVATAPSTAVATVFVEITSGTAGWFSKMAVWKNQIYGTNGGGNNNILYRYTGDASSKAFLEIARVDRVTASPFAELFVYNNRLHMTRNDGMYLWDGTALVTVEDLSHSLNNTNYGTPVSMRGYLYYIMPDGLYRFNGTTIEKLYDKAEIGTILEMCVGKNRLWIIVNNDPGYIGNNKVARYDSTLGYDYHTAANRQFDGRVMCFNGKGIYTYMRLPTITRSASPTDVSEGSYDNIEWIYEYLFVFYYNHPSNHELVRFPTYEYQAGSESTSVADVQLVTPIYDGGYPMIDKSAENVEVLTDGYTSLTNNVNLYYRTSGFDGSTSWTSLGTFSLLSELKQHIWEVINAGVTFKQIQFKISGQIERSIGIKKIVLRSRLTPDYKNQWNLNLACYGDDLNAPLKLRDGSNDTQSVATLVGNIYDARDSDTPFIYIDTDRLTLNGAVNNAVTTITLNSTNLLKGQTGFVKIDDEVMAYTARTSTQLTVVRGQLGTSVASHSDNAKVFPAYRCVIRKITNERIIQTDNSALYNTEDKAQPREISVTLQEV